MTPVKECNTVESLSMVILDSFDPTNNSCNESFFSFESFKQTKKPQWETKSLTIVKAKEETLPMKIVFITHTSQRRGLPTM